MCQSRSPSVILSDGVSHTVERFENRDLAHILIPLRIHQRGADERVVGGCLPILGFLNVITIWITGRLGFTTILSPCSPIFRDR